MTAQKTRRWSFEDIRIMRRMAGTMTISEVADMIGRTRDATRTKAIRMKIPMAQHGEKHQHSMHSDETVETARRMRERGCSMRIIAMETGVKLGTVEDWVYFRTRTNDPVSLR